MSLLKVEGLTKRFGGIVAVNNASFEVGKNEVVGLIGPNGAGKSTLVQLLMGIIKSDAGQVVFNDTDITRLKAWQVVRQGIAGTFQCTKPFLRLPVFANVLVASSAWKKPGVNGADSIGKAMSVLENVGIGHLAKLPASKLSHGDLKRLEIARSLATDPRLLILDEPFGGLNYNEIELLSDLVKKLRSSAPDSEEQGQGGGLSMIIIEHKLSELMKIVDKVIVLNYGKILAVGTPEEVTADEEVINAYIGEEEI